MPNDKRFEKALDEIIRRHICLNFQGDYDFFVSIPVLADEGIFELISSLKKCENPRKRICICILLNDPENAEEKIKKKNKDIFSELKEIEKRGGENHIDLQVKYISSIPDKIAGVGFARRVIMDEIICAIKREVRKNKNYGKNKNYESEANYEGKENPFYRRLIFSLDSDCIVSDEYFVRASRMRGELGVFLFKHRFSTSDSLVKRAGELWELFLRYWRDALRIFGYPFAFYPIGSLFVFRPQLYVRTGGMSIRKAGEDFYFLQKVVSSCNAEDIPAYVFPKASPSERTPFGTGKEIKLYVEGKNERLERVWKIEAFAELQKVISEARKIYREKNYNHSVFTRFKEENPKFAKQLENIRKMCRDEEDFEKRFLLWFTPFKVFKFLRTTEKIMQKGHIISETEKLRNIIEEKTGFKVNWEQKREEHRRKNENKNGNKDENVGENRDENYNISETEKLLNFFTLFDDFSAKLGFVLRNLNYY